LLGFPSIREFGGAVVVEAMMMGLVPIVVDYGGPGELVTKSTGYTVPMGSRAEIVARFREILSRLIAEPSIIAEMGERARDRVLTHFTWDAKARQTLEVYRWVLKSRTDKPNFGMPLDDV
jgi:glycosyltransferase involved in cell wall biosynthesis